MAYEKGHFTDRDLAHLVTYGVTKPAVDHMKKCNKCAEKYNTAVVETNDDDNRKNLR